MRSYRGFDIPGKSVVLNSSSIIFAARSRLTSPPDIRYPRRLNRPGVTLDKQWVATGIGIDLLDMPGVLWPKFDALAVAGKAHDTVLSVSLDPACSHRLIGKPGFVQKNKPRLFAAYAVYLRPPTAGLP